MLHEPRWTFRRAVLMAVLAASAFARAALQHRRRAGAQSNQSDRHRRAGVSLVRDGQGALALRRLYFTKENTNTGAAASCGELDADRPVAGLVRFRLDRPRGNAGRPSAKQGADYILTLLEDSRARIRCGTAAGVSLFDPAAGGDAPFSAISMGMPAGQGSTAETLAEDRLGTMWIGAADGILYAVQAHATKPASIAQRPAPAPGESLSSTFGPLDGELEHVHALFESREGDVWARMYQHLALFPANGEPPRMWRRNYGLLEAEWWRLTALGQDRDGNLWVSTDDVGVLRLAHGGSVTCY